MTVSRKQTSTAVNQDFVTANSHQPRLTRPLLLYYVWTTSVGWRSERIAFVGKISGKMRNKAYTIKFRSNDINCAFCRFCMREICVECACNFICEHNNHSAISPKYYWSHLWCGQRAHWVRLTPQHDLSLSSHNLSYCSPCLSNPLLTNSTHVMVN